MNDEVKKILKEGLKEEGLEIAEDIAIRAAKVLFKKFPQIAAATTNKVDDILVPVVAIVEPKILEMLDVIDGKIG